MTKPNGARRAGGGVFFRRPRAIIVFAPGAESEALFDGGAGVEGDESYSSGNRKGKRRRARREKRRYPACRSGAARSTPLRQGHSRRRPARSLRQPGSPGRFLRLVLQAGSPGSPPAGASPTAPRRRLVQPRRGAAKTCPWTIPSPDRPWTHCPIPRPNSPAQFPGPIPRPNSPATFRSPTL